MKHLTTILCAAALLGCSSTPSSDTGNFPSDGSGEGAAGEESAAVLPMTSPIMAIRERAPEFVLFDQDGFTFPLAEQQGRWLGRGGRDRGQEDEGCHASP